MLESLLNKVADLMPATLLKSDSSVNFEKFLRTHFLQNSFARLFLMSENLSILLHDHLLK